MGHLDKATCTSTDQTSKEGNECTTKVLFIFRCSKKYFTLRLGAQSVTLLSTLRDPTQLRQHPCAFRKKPLLFVPM